jgi:hypothetical protein
MQCPGVFVPFVWTFALDVFPQLPQNVAIVFPVTVCPGGTNSLCMMASVSENKSTLIGHCSELIMLSLVTVKLESSTEMTAALSQGRTQTPKIHHQ